MKKLYEKPSSMYDEIQRMRTAERFRREDRANVSSFYNGAPPISQSEAESLGYTVNVNHLFGYTNISNIKNQAFSVFTKPVRKFEVQLDAAAPGKRSDWGMGATEEACRVLGKITGFKSQYEGICGDAGLHGEACLFRPNRTFPMPRQVPLSKLLIPDDASTDVSELSHFAIESELKLKELHFHYERGSKGWIKNTLGKILKKIYAEVFTENEAIDPNNLEELEYKRQENSASPNYQRLPQVNVYYFYQQRCDLSGAPYDVDILVKTENSEGETTKDVLYSGEECYENINSLLHPFFMDCVMGGQTKWHRILGPGHLNYQLDMAVELLLCRAMQGGMEASMNIWQASNSTDREDIQQILLRNNGVVPEGLTMLQNRFQPNLSGVMEMIQLYRQKGAENAMQQAPNNGGKNDVLEVQAISQENQTGSMRNSRMSNWYDYLDAMWEESFARLCNPFIEAHDPGYSEVMDFQSAMERRGIPLWYLQRSNVKVSSVRVVGDGIRSKELSAAQYLTQNRSQFAPEMQPKITRLTTALVLDDYRLAEELTPQEPEDVDSPQTIAAETENAIMNMSRQPIKPKEYDVDEVHIMQHFPAMDRLIADAVQYQKAAFEPQQLEVFKAIGAHSYAHIERLEQMAGDNKKDPNREKAKAFRGQLNEMAAMAEKLAHNMQQGQQEEMDPVEMANLKLKSDQIQLNRDKLMHNVEKFNRTQDTKEQNLAFNQMMSMQKNHMSEQVYRRDTAVADTKTALDVAKTHHDITKPETATA